MFSIDLKVRGGGLLFYNKVSLIAPFYLFLPYPTFIVKCLKVLSGIIPILKEDDEYGNFSKAISRIVLKYYLIKLNEEI